jgi:hypothetical protein
MAHAAQVIQRFGGARPLARLLNLPATTVQTWKDTGYIPAQRQLAVLNAGRDLEPPLSPCEFFGFPPKRNGNGNKRHRAA